MKKIYAALILSFGLSTYALCASTRSGFDVSQKHSLSDVNYSTLKSTAFASSGVLGQGYRQQLSSGVTRIEFAYISSAGINSMLQILDSRIFQGPLLGNATVQVNGNGDPTNITGQIIPFNYESSTQGIVIVSTCTVCAASPWVAPDFRIAGERIR